jgi:fructose-1,6-bisphosphatase/inositol monophosphatase family enzyme
VRFDPLPTDVLIKAGIGLTRTFAQWGQLPSRTFSKQLAINSVSYKDPNNLTRVLDETTHNVAVLTLKNQFGDEIYVYGEEPRTPKRLHRCRGTVAIIDPIDGTDLVARGFQNWCSALVFVHPKQERILASIVAHSSGEVYFASEQGAFKRVENKRDQALRRPSDESLRLQNAAVCFYGQKPKNMLTLTDSGFLRKLEEFNKRMKKRRKERIDFRLYNFGGNPMIVKIPERTVDAVFELSGQLPHDVVPAAYIARRAGAIITDLKGEPIDLVQALLKPKEPIRYVIAATKTLSDDLLDLLSSTAPAMSQPSH